MSHKDIFKKIYGEFNENSFNGEEEYCDNLENEEEENNQNYLYDSKFDFNNNYGNSEENEEKEKNNENNNTESQNEESSSDDKENHQIKNHSNNLEEEEIGNKSFRPKPQPPSPEFGTMKHIKSNENSQNEEMDELDNAEKIKKANDIDNLVGNNNINNNISPSSSEERREKEFLMREEKKIKEKRENNKKKDNNARKENIIEEKKEEDEKEEQNQNEKEKETENNQTKFPKNQDDKKINESQKQIKKNININNSNINIIEKEEKEEKYIEDRITSSNENSGFIQIKEMNIKRPFQDSINEENNNENEKENNNENNNENNKNGNLRAINYNINSGKNNQNNIQNSKNGYNIIQKNNKNNTISKGIDNKNEKNNKFQLKYQNYLENKKKTILNFDNGLTNINLLNGKKMKYYKNKRIYFRKYTNKNYPSKFQMKLRIRKQKSNSKNAKREDKNRITKDNNNSNLLSRNKSFISDIGLYRKKTSNLNNERICKKIDNVINEYASEEGLSIVNVVQILFDLKIIHELIRNINQNINLNIKEMKKIVNNIKKKDYKKLEELEFLDQLWFTINPSMNEYINTKFFYEILKLMLSSEKKFLNGDIIKDLSLSIENLLNQNIYNNDSYRSYNAGIFISPLSDKKYDQNDLWSVPQLVKMLFKIKSHINNEYENKKNEMIYLKEDEEKELTFKPNLKESNDYFQNYSKFNYYNYNNIDNSGKKKNDFNKIYDRFMKEKENHDKAIEKMREIKLMKENKKCTHMPKINKYYPRSQEKMNGALDKDKKISIYERLYNLSKGNNENSSLKRSKTADFINNNEIKKKTKFNYNKRNILKNGQLINEEENQNKVIEDRIYGKNYDKNHNMKKPMDSTYLNNNNNKKYKKMNINNDQNDIIDNIFITIEIKINNGQSKPLKIYKNQKNSNEMVNNFCEMYNISEEDKKIIINKVKYYQKVFFKENINN